MSSPAYARPVQPSRVPAVERRPVNVVGLGIEGWRPFAIAATAALVVSILFAAWTAFHWVSDQATIDIDDIGEAVAPFIAAASCALAASRNSGRTRLPRALFAASALRCGIGEEVVSVFHAGLGLSARVP